MTPTRNIAELHDALNAVREDNVRFRAEFNLLRGEAAELIGRLETQRERRKPPSPPR